MVDYFLAYVLVLATPGPSMLLTAGLASLRGVRAAVPLSLGLGAGCGLLGAVVYGIAGVLPSSGNWEAVGRTAASLLLAGVGLRIASARPMESAAAIVVTDRHAEFAAGVLTALTNPITAGFFVAQMIGPLAQIELGTAGLLLSTTAVLTVVKSLVVAVFISRPPVRRAVLRHFTAWSRLIGMLFVCLAVQTLGPVLAPALAR